MKALLFLVLFVTSCSTKSKFEILSDSGGVAKARLTRKEFNSDSAAILSANNAKNEFVQSARHHAASSGLILESIEIVDAEFKSNPFNGFYSTTLTGWLKHGKKSPLGIAFQDNSRLMILAEQKQRSEDGMQRILGGVAAGSLAASAAMQHSMAVQSQNAALNNLSNSIDRNTNAINALPRNRYYMAY